MNNVLKLRCGTVTLLDFITRKIMRLYRQALFNGSKTTVDVEGQKLGNSNIDAAAIDLANDVLVQNIIALIQDENGKTIELTQVFFDYMDQNDFDAILNYANALMVSAEKEKKS